MLFTLRKSRGYGKPLTTKGGIPGFCNIRVKTAGNLLFEELQPLPGYPGFRRSGIFFKDLFQQEPGAGFILDLQEGHGLPQEGVWDLVAFGVFLDYFLVSKDRLFILLQGHEALTDPELGVVSVGCFGIFFVASSRRNSVAFSS